MRRTRLFILPGARCLTQTCCILLYLSCPIIGALGHDQPDLARDDLYVKSIREIYGKNTFLKEENDICCITDSRINCGNPYIGKNAKDNSLLLSSDTLRNNSLNYVNDNNCLIRFTENSNPTTNEINSIWDNSKPVIKIRRTISNADKYHEDIRSLENKVRLTRHYGNTREMEKGFYHRSIQDRLDRVERVKSVRNIRASTERTIDHNLQQSSELHKNQRINTDAVRYTRSRTSSNGGFQQRTITIERATINRNSNRRQNADEKLSTQMIQQRREVSINRLNSNSNKENILANRQQRGDGIQVRSRSNIDNNLQRTQKGFPNIRFLQVRDMRTVSTERSSSHINSLGRLTTPTKTTEDLNSRTERIKLINNSQRNIELTRDTEKTTRRNLVASTSRSGLVSNRKMARDMSRGRDINNRLERLEITRSFVNRVPSRRDSRDRYISSSRIQDYTRNPTRETLLNRRDLRYRSERSENFRSSLNRVSVQRNTIEGTTDNKRLTVTIRELKDVPTNRRDINELEHLKSDRYNRREVTRHDGISSRSNMNERKLDRTNLNRRSDQNVISRNDRINRLTRISDVSELIDSGRITRINRITNDARYTNRQINTEDRNTRSVNRVSKSRDLNTLTAQSSGRLTSRRQSEGPAVRLVRSNDNDRKRTSREMSDRVDTNSRFEMNRSTRNNGVTHIQSRSDRDVDERITRSLRTSRNLRDSTRQSQLSYRREQNYDIQSERRIDLRRTRSLDTNRDADEGMTRSLRTTRNLRESTRQTPLSYRREQINNVQSERRTRSLDTNRDADEGMTRSLRTTRNLRELQSERRIDLRRTRSLETISFNRGADERMTRSLRTTRNLRESTRQKPLSYRREQINDVQSERRTRSVDTNSFNRDTGERITRSIRTSRNLRESTRQTPLSYRREQNYDVQSERRIDLRRTRSLETISFNRGADERMTRSLRTTRNLRELSRQTPLTYRGEQNDEVHSERSIDLRRTRSLDTNSFYRDTGDRTMRVARNIRESTDKVSTSYRRERNNNARSDNRIDLRRANSLDRISFQRDTGDLMSRSLRTNRNTRELTSDISQSYRRDQNDNERSERPIDSTRTKSLSRDVRGRITRSVSVTRNTRQSTSNILPYNRREQNDNERSERRIDSTRASSSNGIFSTYTDERMIRSMRIIPHLREPTSKQSTSYRRERNDNARSEGQITLPRDRSFDGLSDRRLSVERVMSKNKFIENRRESNHREFAQRIERVESMYSKRNNNHILTRSNDRTFTVENNIRQRSNYEKSHSNIILQDMFVSTRKDNVNRLNVERKFELINNERIRTNFNKESRRSVRGLGAHDETATKGFESNKLLVNRDKINSYGSIVNSVRDINNNKHLLNPIEDSKYLSQSKNTLANQPNWKYVATIIEDTISSIWKLKDETKSVFFGGAAFLLMSSSVK